MSERHQPNSASAFNSLGDRPPGSADQPERTNKEQKNSDAPLVWRKKRGRPPNGLDKALTYTNQVWELRAHGVTPWAAIKDVAEGNRKTPRHIAHCVKMVCDGLPWTIWEYDETDRYLKGCQSEHGL